MTELDNLPDIDATAPVEVLDAVIADCLLPYSEKTAVKLLGTVSDLSDQEPLYAASAAVLATAALMRDGPTWRMGTRILAAHLLATGLRGIFKHLVDRTRPDAAARRGDYVLRKGQRRESDFSSFPSGHTAGAVAVALAVSRDHPGARTPAMVLATVAGVAQVVRCKHYVTDVVAGAVIAIAAETLTDSLIRRAQRV
jgi:membrane-associated phospholipid phosphatase